MGNNNRRDFIRKSILTGVGLIAVPSIYKGSLFSKGSANDLIRFAQIGCGRQCTED
jgi:hypothetical protein